MESDSIEPATVEAIDNIGCHGRIAGCSSGARNIAPASSRIEHERTRSPERFDREEPFGAPGGLDVVAVGRFREDMGTARFHVVPRSSKVAPPFASGAVLLVA